MNFKKSTVKLDDFELEYITFGSGKKNLVIIPGMSFKPITVYAEAVANQYSAFNDEYTVYLFDRRKDLNKTNSTINNMTYELILAMKKLGIFDAYVVGVSQGGMMAQVMAAEYPEYVKKIIVASSLTRHNNTSALLFETWRDLAFDNKEEELCDSVLKTLHSEEFYAEHKEALKATVSGVTPEEIYRYGLLCNACRSFDYYDEVKKIKCPVLVIGAENDRVMDIKGSVELAERLGCELYIYKDAEHAVYDEAPDYPARMKNFFEK